MQFQKKIRMVFLLIFITFPLAKSFSQEVLFERDALKYAFGDSSEWSMKDYNDNNWNIVYTNYIPYESNKLWLRTKFYSDVSDSIFNNYQILVSMTATYELYWNGEYIGNNCISGDDISLRNGQFSKIFNLPGSKIADKNSLALRILIGNGEDIEIADLLIEKRNEEFEDNSYVYVFLSALFFIHLFFLYLFISNPLKFSKLQVVYFSILLTSILFALIYEALLFLGIITYHHDLILKTIEFYQNNFLLLGISIFYFGEFNVKNRNLYVFATALAIIVLNYFKVSDGFLYFAGLSPSIFLMIWATIKKKVAALYSLVFLLIILSITYAWFVFLLNDISFLIFPAFFIVRKIRLDAEEAKKMHEAELRAVRLETEMLKKILQPHYIMNSLNSVVEWIEETPKHGLRFIQALSDEFRLFLTFSNRKFITIKDEINLCKKHLKIMEFRHHRNYSMLINVENLNDRIPPAILHTLIENGITHNLKNSDIVCFLIFETQTKNKILFKVIVHYKHKCEELNWSDELEPENSLPEYTDIKEGAGIKYIRARLTECYGDSWDITFRGNENIWMTEIEIYNGTK